MHPATVFVDHLTLCTRTVDSLVAEHQITGISLLVMDLGGAEGLCLARGHRLVGVARLRDERGRRVYVGAVMVDALDRILSDYERTETLWVADFGWGDRWWVLR